MEGFKVTILEEVVTQADLFVTTTGNKDIIKYAIWKQMKDSAIVCNIGHFDNEIQVAQLAGLKKLILSHKLMK